MPAPRLLDLFCGAGGCARGYVDAGFDVTGIDLAPQPHYPYLFIQANALDYLAEHGREYDAIHASPPCQGYSIMRNLPWLKAKTYPMLIDPVRELLERTGKPWVIENVMGAKLKAGYLCGTMFGRRFYRHRYFETNWLWLAPRHQQHRIYIGNHRGRGSRDFVATETTPVTGVSGISDEDYKRLGNHRASHGLTAWQSNGIPSGVGHTAGFAEVKREMGIDWMTRDELTQAIPPCYTQFVGAQLRLWLNA